MNLLSKTPTSGKSASKNLALEGLRGCACMAVAIGHFAYVFFPYLANNFRPYPGLHPLYWFEKIVDYPPFSLIISADAAVSIFFVLSGYVLTVKYFNTGDTTILQDGASKRYVRLVCPCFVAMMFSWVIWSCGLMLTSHAGVIGVAGWIPSEYTGHMTFFRAIFNGLVGTPLFGNVTLDGPLWSIQVELIGSLILFGTLSVLGKHPFWFIAWFLFFANILGYGKMNDLYYVSFGAGALLNLARNWLQKHEIPSIALVILGLIFVAFNHFYIYRPIQVIPLPNFLPYGPNFADGGALTAELWWHTIGSILLVAGIIGSRHAAALFSMRLPTFLGRISFSVYILHWPIMMSLGLAVAWGAQKAGFSYASSATIAFFAFMGATIALSVIFERYIDLPSIKLANFIAARGKAMLSRRPQADIKIVSEAGVPEKI